MNVSSQGPLVILINSLMHGGAQRLAIHDLNELYARGIDVRLITLEAERANDSMMEECRLPPSQRTCIRFPSFLALGSWWRLWSILHAWRPRALITHLWFSNTVGRICAILAGIPTRLSFEHNVYEGIRHRWQYVIDRWLARHSTAVIAVSEAVRQFLLRHGISESRVRLLRNAIEMKPSQARTDPSEARKALNLTSEECVVICVGRLIPQKGIDILLRVFATLPKGVLLVVGDGAERASLERLIHELHLNSRVQLLGTRTDVADLLRLADIFVLPSRWEGLPMVVLEAMAAGLPIVASAVDGTREVLVDQKTGLLVPPESEAALRAALERCIEEVDLRRTLGVAAQKEVQSYSIARHVDQLLELAGFSKTNIR